MCDFSGFFRNSGFLRFFARKYILKIHVKTRRKLRGGGGREGDGLGVR